MKEKIKVGSDFSGVGALIKGFEKYIVTKEGDVFNIFSRKKLKPQLRSGYHKVTLSNKGISKQLYIHRIVATAFIPNPELKKEVNHKDGNKFNNNSSNLEWVTRSENSLHSYSNGLQDKQKGSSHGQAKLNEELVNEIRDKRQKGIDLKTLSIQYGVATSTLSQIINYQRWKHV